MTDLISRADAIEAVCEWGTNEERIGTLTMPMVSIKQTVTDILSALPSADITETEECQKCQEATERVLLNKASAEAVQGEWGHMIADGTDGSHWYEYECSHCGEVVLRPYNFCPNCGANMEGGNDK